jgi:competence protein ComEC
MAVLVAFVCLVGGAASGWIRAVSVLAGPVDDLAAAGAVVTVAGVLTTDPSVRTTGTGPRRSAYVVGRLRVDEVTGRGAHTRVRTPVLLLATDPGWADLRPGQRIVARGRLGPADGWGDIAGCLARDPPARGSAGWPHGHGAAAWDCARRSSDFRRVRGACPRFVGDESMMAARLRDDRSQRTAATSTPCTNDTSWSRLAWPGGGGSEGTVCRTLRRLLARPELSVVRAAVMGPSGSSSTAADADAACPPWLLRSRCAARRSVARH